jgi:hypothetical protein
MFNYLESDEGKAVDAVIIWKLDRLARDLYIQEHLIKKLEALKVKLISTKEADLDSNEPMRKAFRQFMGVVSELEKAFITMRLQGGRMQKAKSGGFAGGAAALGYVSEGKELKLQAADVETIRTIFKLKKNNHYSINEIARYLTEQGIRPNGAGGGMPRPFPTFCGTPFIRENMNSVTSQYQEMIYGYFMPSLYKSTYISYTNNRVPSSGNPLTVLNALFQGIESPTTNFFPEMMHTSREDNRLP